LKYDLTDLKVFLAVVEEGNLSRGALRCHLAPSSVSVRIRALEASFGTALLDRTGRGVSPTSAGLVLAENARLAIAQLEQMHAALQPFANGVTGRVILFANNNAISSFLPDDLAKFFQAFPSVRVSLEERNSSEIVSALVEGRCDVGIVVVETAHPDVIFYPYRDDELVLLVPYGNHLGERNSIKFSECLSQPFISLLPGAALHAYLVNHAAALGAKLDVRVRVSGYRAIARLVASGAGIGVVPRSAMEPANEKELHVLKIDDSWAKRDLKVCLRRSQAVSTYRDALITCLRGETDKNF